MRAIRALVLAGVSAVTLPACVATVEPEYAEATYVPAHIETYPYVIYEGRPVYYAHEHWYYRDGPRWVYYRHEPETLQRQRAYVQQAPRAPQPYVRHPEYAAPPARQVPQPEYSAPPARQVPQPEYSAPPARQVR